MERALSCRHMPPPPAGELRRQGPHLQALAARNGELQHTAAALRLELSISVASEEGLARKALASEHAADALVGFSVCTKERAWLPSPW